MLGVFLVVIVVDALIGVWNPLIYREIIDGGIARHNSHLIVLLALLLGGPGARRRVVVAGPALHLVAGR